MCNYGLTFTTQTPHITQRVHVCVCACMCTNETEEVLNVLVPVRSQAMLTGAVKYVRAHSQVYARHPSAIGTQFLQCCQLNFKK